MRRLLQFLFRYRAFLLFLFLESLSFWLIVENNSYQGARYFNSANAFTGSISQASHDLIAFFNLSRQNKILAEENARLKSRLLSLPDSLAGAALAPTEIDSSVWNFVPAKVINNSVFLQNNHITLDKGTKEGVYKGMGVIGSEGAVGQVVAASDHFSSVASILHGALLVSSMHEPSGSLCTTSWDGLDPLYVNIQYLPRHLSLYQGDTILTSGYNTLFPPGTMIGTIEDVSIAEDDTFYNIRAKLSTNFYQLSYVYLVDFKMKEQKDSLERAQQLRYE